VTLAELIPHPAADLAAYLDGLDPSARWAEVRRLGRAEQRALYHRAGPAQLASLGPAVHDGRNTLPLPGPLRMFQKHFHPLDPDRMAGFNDGPTRRLLGPGYFVATADGDGVVFDYDAVPETAPSGWPPVIPNSQRLQRFVYSGTHDLLRGVSEHVTIGAVYKGERSMDHYFVLCRRP
jgi:hypothetical protein